MRLIHMETEERFTSRIEEQRSLMLIANNSLDEKFHALQDALPSSGINPEFNNALELYGEALVYATRQTEITLFISSMVRTGIQPGLILTILEQLDELNRDSAS